MTTADQNLAALRQAMQRHGLDAFVIPSADPHLSEYLPEHWQARRDLSGFTGSVGTLAVTPQKAGLWVDSRYWEQAEQQLAGSGIALQKMGEVAPYTEWLAENLPQGAAVGVPADMLSLTGKRGLKPRWRRKTSASNTPKPCWTKCGRNAPRCRLKKFTSTIPLSFPKPPPKNSPACVPR